MNLPHRPRFRLPRTRVFWFGFAVLVLLTAGWVTSAFLRFDAGYETRHLPLGNVSASLTGNRLQIVVTTIPSGTWAARGVRARWSWHAHPDLHWELEKPFSSVTGTAGSLYFLQIPTWPIVPLWITAWILWMKRQAWRRRAHLIESTPPADD